MLPSQTLRAGPISSALRPSCLRLLRVPPFRPFRAQTQLNHYRHFGSRYQRFQQTKNFFYRWSQRPSFSISERLGPKSTDGAESNGQTDSCEWFARPGMGDPCHRKSGEECVCPSGVIFLCSKSGSNLLTACPGARCLFSPIFYRSAKMMMGWRLCWDMRSPIMSRIMQLRRCLPFSCSQVWLFFWPPSLASTRESPKSYSNLVSKCPTIESKSLKLTLLAFK